MMNSVPNRKYKPGDLVLMENTPVIRALPRARLTDVGYASILGLVSVGTYNNESYFVELPFKPIVGLVLQYEEPETPGYGSNDLEGNHTERLFVMISIDDKLPVVVRIFEESEFVSLYNDPNKKKKSA